MTNQSDAKRCPDCGTLLASSLPAGLCPACLMEKAFAPNASEAPIDPTGLAATQTLNPNRGNSTNEPDTELSAGQNFGDYHIIRRLGRGGMGTVYEADHQTTGRRVALKVLTHALDNREARARFLREGRLAASINHPNSVYVYGTEEIAGTPTISMELIRGGTLQQWVKASDKIETAAAVDAVLQIIDGLEAADDKGVLHRDVKPANCFIDPSGIIKVGDFGLSITTEPRDDQSMTQVTREGFFLGTPAFASPEQLRGEPLDRRSDIYSVGVTLFYLLTGQVPFSGENMVHLLATVLDRDAPNVQSLRADVPAEVNNVIARCLQKSAGQRYASYDDLRQALLPLSSQQPKIAEPSSRVLANLIDILLLSGISLSLTYLVQALWYGEISVFPSIGDTGFSTNQFGVSLAWALFCWCYYAICDWRFGKTIGKHLLGLRVVSHGNRINFRQSVVRAAIFSALPNIPMLLRLAFTDFDLDKAISGELSTGLVGTISIIAYYGLRFGIFATMRLKNGYAGIHEMVSDTRVIANPNAKAKAVPAANTEQFDKQSPSVSIGPYQVLKELMTTNEQRLILCYDTKLLRRVWVHVLPSGNPAVDSAARNFARAGRLRWLGGLRSENENWDCYEAPTGKYFVDAINEGTNWLQAVDALRQLAKELKVSCDESSLEPNITINQLWITEDNVLKLLPFNLATESSAEDDNALGENDASKSANRLLHEAIQFVDQSFQPLRDQPSEKPKQTTSIPLRVGQSLRNLAQSPIGSLNQANNALAEISKTPWFNVSLRVRGVVLASLFLPMLVIASSLMSSIAWEHQRHKYPAIDELGYATTVLNILTRVQELQKTNPALASNAAITDANKRKIEIVKTWIAGEYRDAIADPRQMNSNLAKFRIRKPMREQLQTLINQRSPSAEETQQAGEEFQRIVQELDTTQPATITFFSLSGALFSGCFVWLTVIWLPSLIAAVVARGGILQRTFGLALANRQGLPASRLRVFVRMLIGGIPALAVMIFTFDLLHLRVYELNMVSEIALLIVVAVALTRPARMIHDRIAGTQLVAR